MGDGVGDDGLRALGAVEGDGVAGLGGGGFEGFEEDGGELVCDGLVHDDAFGAEADLTVVGEGCGEVRDCLGNKRR